MRRRQRRMKANPSAPEGLALQGASAALRGLPVEPTTACAKISELKDSMIEAPLIRQLGLAAYEPTWRAMQKFTDDRQDATPDELWFVEHPPVFTLGLNASREHLLAPGDIPVVQIDRGGQVTYHGPGQLMIYPLLNLLRLKLGVRDLVMALENAVIAYTAELGIAAAG